MINALEKPDEGMEVSKIKKIKLKNLNAEFRFGDIVRVAGKNGSGKNVNDKAVTIL